MEMKLSDIKISEDYAATLPRERKMSACRDYWDRYHLQDRDIVIDRNHVLVDGYIMYLVLQEKNERNASVRVLGWEWKHNQPKKDKITYVYAVHPNSKTHKEYIWRVPKSWGSKFAETLAPGDIIRCCTVEGVKPVIVKRVVRSEKPPIGLRINRVKDRSIRRDGKLIKLEANENE